MTLSDLSDNNRRILALLKDIHTAGRRHIADLTGLEPNQVSSALNRLESMGYIDKPDGPGRGWTMSESGYALFGLRPGVVAEPETERADSWIDDIPTIKIRFPISKPKQKPEPEPVAGPYPAGKSAEIMAAMEIDLALEQVRGRLTAPLIPARAARVYREILAALPPVLAEALAPITALVEAQG